MEQENITTIICPFCRSENPDISVCLTCGSKIRREKLNAKDLIPRPVGLTFLAGLYALGFMRNTFLILYQKNGAAIIALIIFALIDISLAYGLWQLKRWTWTVVVISCYAGIVLVWLMPVLLWLDPSEGLRMFFRSFLSVSFRDENLVKDLFMAAAIKASLIRAIVRSIINILILIYFYSKRIQGIFSDNPVNWKAARL